MHELQIPLDGASPGCYIPPELKGTQMKAVRKANDLTQAETAKMLGVSRVYYTQMETGVRKINQRTALAFVAVINSHKLKQERKTA